MTTVTLHVERSGYAVVQDLGRPGYAALGIAANGAGDRRSARTANVLVGNADDAPVLEVTGSDLGLVAEADLVVAVTGAADHVLVAGHPQPAWETLLVPAGASLVVPEGPTGLRSYLAVNGTVAAESALGSVAPDPLLDVGHRLEAGERIEVRTAYRADPLDPHPGVFRLGARPSRLGTPVDVRATAGPDLDRLARGVAALDATFEVLPQSDHVGLRFSGPTLELSNRDEILSRGVPVGAVEVPPSGDLVILMRGRLVTAGYPVVAVVTSTSVDALAQTRPGDRVRIELCDLAAARADLVAQDEEHRRLAARVRGAFEARGLGHLLSPHHGGSGTGPRSSPGRTGRD